MCQPHALCTASLGACKDFSSQCLHKECLHILQVFAQMSLSGRSLPLPPNLKLHIAITTFYHLPSLVYFLKFYWTIVEIFNVVLVSGVQQSVSVIHTRMSTLFYILFPYSHYRVLSTVLCTQYIAQSIPCAMQEVLISSLSHLVSSIA